MAEDAKGLALETALPQIPLNMDEVRRAIDSRETVNLTLQRTGDTKNARHLETTVFPLVYSGVQGAVIRIDDETEKQHMRLELAHNRKLDALGQLAGGVAHDFNNMLGRIISGAELLSVHYKDDPKAQKYINIIIQAGQRAGDLTQKLLLFARKGKIESTMIDVAKAIYDAAAIFDHTLDKRIKVEIRIDAKKTLIMGDLSQIQNALINLGVNSGHAMPDGGVLSISLKQLILDEIYCQASPFDISPGPFLDLEVRDTGSGIPPEDLDKIFEPFFTTKEAGKGSGLGLSAVYGALKDHGGAITVYSEPGTGTCFHLYLPLMEVADLSVENKKDSPVTGQGRILVIDDEPTILATTKSILESLGYEVMTAENGREGLELYRDKHAQTDLVIIDMIMPEMNGTQCFFAMKRINNDIKVLLASGFTRETELEELMENGLKGFLHKPFTTIQLSHAVLSAITDEEHRKAEK